MSAIDDRAANFRRELEREYARRFPASKAHFARYGDVLLDGASHAMRWCDPFMPVVRRASGATIEDLDGNVMIDYWQGHFTNLLGHNPPLIRDALVRLLGDGQGLQSGMLHEVEAEVCDAICRGTGCETTRLTTSGSLGAFYATLLARAFTGRELVLKVSGGWHGSQPFGLKGVSAHGTSFDHLESEGLSPRTADEVALVRLNDLDELKRRFATDGDRIACFVIEPMLGAAGGMTVTVEYMRELRRLTEHHGALLLCDEIITGYRFRAGDLTSTYGVKPDLLLLGKVIGGGMPVAAVTGRRDVLELGTRASHRVKFEGGTYSAHELSLVAAREMLRHLEQHGEQIYPRLAALGERMREGVGRVARAAGVPVHVLGASAPGLPGSSLVYMHVVQENTAPPACPDEAAAHRHPLIGERLLKSVLLLEDLSTRSGIGAISLAHTDDDLDRSLDRLSAGFDRLTRAGLV